jgi:N,N'-diacetyllegionaminate synthase
MIMQGIVIGDRNVGEGNPAFIIAEVAQAHEGSLGTAHAYVDAAAEAGVDAIKFQVHLAQFESTKDEPFRVNFSYQDKTRYDYWKRMEFSSDQWAGLARHAAERNLIFLSSPFSVQAVRMLNDIGMAAWKIGSGEVRSKELLDAIAETNSPVLLSTGMSTMAEIRDSVRFIREKGLAIAIFQCTSEYPTPFKNIGLNMIEAFKNEYGCPVGLSDHSGTVFPGLAALARGANLIEVHIIFDKRMFGPDVTSSVTIEEVKLLSDARKAFHEMDRHPVDKDVIAARMTETRAYFGKSLAPTRHLSAGTKIGEDMLTEKKPGTGIPVSEKNKLIGSRFIREVGPEHLLKWEDIDG